MPETRARRRRAQEEEVPNHTVNGAALSTSGEEAAAAAAPGGPEKENKELKRSKIVTRVAYGALMVLVFLGTTLAGHMYIFSLVLVRTQRVKGGWKQGK